MVLIRRDSSKGKRFDAVSLRDRLQKHFPEAKFDSEEQFAKNMRLLNDLPEYEKPSKTIIDDIERTAQACGPSYAFLMDAYGVIISGNVRSVDAVFLMDKMPPDTFWNRIVAFAESIEGGTVVIQENS